MTVYYLVDNNCIRLKTLDKRFSLYQSYLDFQTGNMRSAGFRNYHAYLEQIRQYLVKDKCVHFVITDDDYYGFQKLVYIHGGVGLSSEGFWTHRSDRAKITEGLKWIKSERDRLIFAHNNIRRDSLF
jgi:hypothetical protein